MKRFNLIASTSHSCKNIASLLCLASLLCASFAQVTLASEKNEAIYKKNGSIHIDNATLVMSPNGQIFITNSQGDRYNIHLSLVSRKSKKWFTGSQLTDKKVKVDVDAKKTIFTASLTKEQSDSPVEIELSLKINERDNAEISLRYITDTPIEEILTLANLHIHSPRKQMAGSKIQVDRKTFMIEVGKSPVANLINGFVKRIGFFANQPKRSIVIRPTKIKSFTLNDYNITTRDPYIELRFLPLNNEIIFEVDVFNSLLTIKPEAQKKK